MSDLVWAYIEAILKLLGAFFVDCVKRAYHLDHLDKET